MMKVARLAFVTVCSLLVLTNGYDMSKTKCCFPPGVSGKIGAVQGMAKPSPMSFEYLVDFANDNENAIQGSRSTVAGRQLWTIIDYRAGKMWEIEAAAKKCSLARFKPTTDFQCLPDEAIVASYRMGADIPVTTYRLDFDPIGTQMYLTVTRTDAGDCLPVTMVNQGGKWQMMQAGNYANLKTKIDDPSILEVPDYCPKE